MGFLDFFRKAAPKPEASQPQSSVLSILGGVGLRSSGGRISEEFEKSLQGPKAIKIYREMSDNDAYIGAFIYALTNFMLAAPDKFEPADDSPEAQEIADFFNDCTSDMASTWANVRSEMVQAAIYGWDVMEIIYKLRRGDDSSPMFHSKHNDGLFGWRDWEPRPQDTLDQWVFDDNGVAVGFWQVVPPKMVKKYVPLDRCFHLRFATRKKNPEGDSLLRRSKRSWHFAKNLEEQEAIRVERDCSGILNFQVPPEYLSANATQEQKALVEGLLKAGAQFKNNQSTCIISAAEEVKDGATGFKLISMQSGKNLADTDTIIMRHHKAKLMAVMADFIFLGQDGVGSYSLSSDKTNMFSVSLGRLLCAISDEINRSAVPTLMRLNGFDMTMAPVHKHGDIEKEDIQKFVTTLAAAVSGGLIVADSAVERAVREILGLPEHSTETAPAQPVTAQPAPTQEQAAPNTSEVPNGSV